MVTLLSEADRPKTSRFFLVQLRSGILSGFKMTKAAPRSIKSSLPLDSHATNDCQYRPPDDILCLDGISKIIQKRLRLDSMRTFNLVHEELTPLGGNRTCDYPGPSGRHSTHYPSVVDDIIAVIVYLTRTYPSIAL